MKSALITTAVILLALTLVQSASAASMFVHNMNVPPDGAQVTYRVNDHTSRYMYTFHRLVTIDRPDIELPLPEQFRTYDSVSVSMHESAPSELDQDTPNGVMGDLGMDAWFDLSSDPQQ